MGQEERCQGWTGDVCPELVLNGGRVGYGMSHPDSYGHSHTQLEKIFHTLKSFHSIKLSINYFNPQIKDNAKCLMFIC